MTAVKSANRVLIYRLGSLGDTMVALPCLHLIERTFPNAQRVLLTNFPVNSKAPAASAVLTGSGLIHRYIRYPIATRRPLDIAKLWWQLVRFRPDVLIYLMPKRSSSAVRRDSLFFKSLGIRHSIGLQVANGTLHIWDERAGLFEKEASRLARLIAELGDAKPDLMQNWDLRLTAVERQTASLSLAALQGRPFIVCGPGTKMQAKDWGKENWQSLMAVLSDQLSGYALVLVGATEEGPVAEKVREAWSGPSLNLCGTLSPRETAAVIHYGDAFLGPDSGPMHLAASVGVPSVIAFSSRGKPGVWFPAGESHQILYRRTDCFGCNLETCIDRKRECLTSITVNDMCEATLRAVGTSAARRSNLRTSRQVTSGYGHSAA